MFHAIYAGIVGMIGWGMSDVATSLGLDKGYRSAYIGLFYYLIVTVALYIYVVISPNEIVSLPWQVWIILSILALLNYLAYKLFFHSLKDGAVGTSSAIFSTYSGMGIPVSVFVFAESGDTAKWVILLMIVACAFGISITQSENLEKVSWTSISALLAALSLAFMFPILDATIFYFGHATFLVTVLNMLIGVIFLLDVTLTKSFPKTDPFNRKLWVFINPVLAMGGLANAVAIFAVTWGFDVSPHTSIIVVISSAAVIPASLVSHFFVGERHILSKVQWALIFATAVLVMLIPIT